MAERKSIIPYIGSMSFDGVDDIVNCGSVLLAPALQSFTARVVFKKNGSSGTFRHLITSGFNTGANGWWLRYTDTNLFNVSISNGTTTVSANSTILRHNTEWNDAVMVCDRTTNILYLDFNGQLLACSAIAADFSVNAGANSAFLIGARNAATPSLFFGGGIKGVRGLLGVALTAEEVLNLHLHNITPYDNDPAICVLNLETTAHQIVGDQWLDKSGNNNHATISGATFSYQKPSQRRNLIGAPADIKGAYDGTVSGGVTIADGAMVFDGVDGHVNLGKAVLTGGKAPITEASWSFWVIEDAFTDTAGFLAKYDAVNGRRS